MSTTRRRFVQTSAALGALAIIGASARAASDEKSELGDKTPTKMSPRAFSISLAEWSYHDALQKGRMLHADFARVAKETHGIHAVEYVNSFFKDKVGDVEFVKDLKKRADDLSVKILLVMCDGEGDLGHADKAKRVEAVANHRKWLEAARELGCHSIRVNAYGSGTPDEHMAQAADGLRALCVLADPLGLNVIVENHGGMSSNGAWLASVMKRADHPRIGTLPDFGNFSIGEGKTYDRYQGVSEMMPFAKAVSAKSHEFDEKGDETSTDYAKMMRIVLDAGYRGYVGIEYEGSRLSEKDGVDATKRLLERVRGDVR
ncbi:MAG: sugar phosphate isomerase/epimerase family protein [Planctomycetota bacterium]|nr:sugar phosphate isomerase/epimerase family protein [Planctomycetota bacterium]